MCSICATKLDQRGNSQCDADKGALQFGHSQAAPVGCLAVAGAEETVQHGPGCFAQGTKLVNADASAIAKIREGRRETGALFLF